MSRSTAVKRLRLLSSQENELLHVCIKNSNLVVMPHPNTGIILSYPRSGNHLVRFLIEFATGKPTHGCIGNDNDQFLCKNNYPNSESPLHHVKGIPEFIKFHWVHDILYSIQNKRITEPGKLIVIIRNPIECIARNIGYSWNEEENPCTCRQIHGHYQILSEPSKRQASDFI